MVPCTRPDDYPENAKKTEDIANWAAVTWSRGHSCADKVDELQKYIRG